ncbi:YncE family protein [Wenyingzhuangia sp. IMCC45574]
MKTTKQLLALFFLAILFVGCQDEEIVKVEREYTDGVLISGEGSGAGTGSVTFVPSDKSAKFPFVYLTANGQELGTFLQSISFSDERAYIIVDNANTITVVDKQTFVKEAAITTGLITPRYMAIANGKGYATNWGSTSSSDDDFVAVIDLATNTVEKTIAVANGPEQILAKEGKLYVSHKGAFGVNNIVSVIDVATEAITTITVNDKPDEMFFNEAGNLIVLSQGNIVYNPWPTIESETKGAIHIIDVATNTVSKSLELVDGEHPSLMSYDSGKIYYYVSGKVFETDADATVLPTTEVLSQSLYGMVVKDGELHGVNASFSAQSDYYVYDLATKAELYKTKVALGASKVYFVE